MLAESPQKPEVREIHLLVHPFYSEIQEMGERLEVWKGLIRYLKRKKGALVLVGLRLSPKERNSYYYDELVAFAKKELGPRFFHVLPLGSKKFGSVSGPISGDARSFAVFRNEHANELLSQWNFNPKQVKVHAYGEYGNYCVLGNLQNFLLGFGLPWNRNIKVDAIHSSFDLSSSFFPPRRLFRKGQKKNSLFEKLSPEHKRFYEACLKINAFKRKWWR